MDYHLLYIGGGVFLGLIWFTMAVITVGRHDRR